MKCAFVLSGSARGGAVGTHCDWAAKLCFVFKIEFRPEKTSREKFGVCLNICMHCQANLIYKHHPKNTFYCHADFFPAEYAFLNTHPLPFNSALRCQVELVRLPLTKPLVQQS